MPHVPHHAVRAIEAIAKRMVRELGDNPAALRLQSEAKRLQEGTAALDNVNAHPSPLDTPDGHALKVARLAKKLDAQITDSINRAGDILRDGLSDAQRRIDEKVDLRPNAFASEIRAVFRGLSSTAKAAMINDLVVSNRGPELAAIVKAPLVLTGITEDRRETYERMILSKHASAELNEQAKLEEVHHAFMRAEQAASRFVQGLTDPKRVANIESNEARAIAASEGFERSLQ